MTARSCSILAAFLLGGLTLHPAAAATVAKVDSTFVGKVSQGGSFEVLASQLAVDRAQSPAVKSFAQNDVTDHVKVNDELKSIAAAQSLPLAPALNTTLQGKLDRLAKLNGPAFDKAYIDGMKAIHKKDEGIFATEARKGADDAWKSFAAKTDEIVKGHIGALSSINP